MYTRRGTIVRRNGMGNWADDLAKVFSSVGNTATQVINTVNRPTFGDLAQRAGVEIPAAASSYGPILLIGAALILFASKRR